MGAATVEIAAAQAARRRREALGPFADAVAEVLAAAGDPRWPDSVQACGREVDLGAWEKSVLREARASGAADDRAELVVDGLAFQAKCREVVDRVDHQPLPDPEERLRLIETLVRDAAVGLALQQELQHEVNELIRAGRTAEAKTLTAFRNRIVRTSSRLAEIVDGDLALRAAELAQPMISEPRARARPAPPAHAEAPVVARRAARRPAGPASAGSIAAGARTRRLPLGMLLPVLGVLVVVALWLNADLMVRDPGPVVLGPGAFTEIEGVQAVTSRPPAVYVTLDEAAWDAAPPAEQRRRLEAVARVVESAGYLALHARAGSGRALGRWDPQAGVTLLQRPSGGS